MMPEIYLQSIFHLIQRGRVSQSKPEVYNMACFGDPQSLSPGAGIIGGTPCPPSICMGSEDLNSDLFACMSTTESSPQPCL